MARLNRLLLEDRPTVYHVMSRTALDGFPLGRVEKEFLLHCIKHYAALYFTEILGFCIMGNHFHLLVRMVPEDAYSDDEVVRRYRLLHGEDAPIFEQQIPMLRTQWSSLSCFVRDIKQRFSRYYNKKYGRKGYFWGDRYKSVIIEQGRTLVNCLAYIDLNPVRAGLVDKPEDYRWCSIGYHLQSGNSDAMLSTDFGLVEWNFFDSTERLRRYREYLYETGGLERNKGGRLREELLNKVREKNYEYSKVERMLLRTRYFTESCIIGSSDFVQTTGRLIGLQNVRKRPPSKISGFDLLYAG